MKLSRFCLVLIATGLFATAFIAKPGTAWASGNTYPSGPLSYGDPDGGNGAHAKGFRLAFAWSFWRSRPHIAQPEQRMQVQGRMTVQSSRVRSPYR